MSKKNSQKFKYYSKLVTKKLEAAGFKDTLVAEVVGYQKVKNPARDKQLKEIEDQSRENIAKMTDPEEVAQATMEFENRNVKYDEKAPEYLTYAKQRAANPFRRAYRKVMSLSFSAIKNFLTSDLATLPAKAEESKQENPDANLAGTAQEPTVSDTPSAG